LVDAAAQPRSTSGLFERWWMPAENNEIVHRGRSHAGAGFSLHINGWGKKKQIRKMREGLV